MAPSDVLVARDVEAGDQASGVNPVALSKPSCRRCAGLGAIRTRWGYRTCVCVLRRVFRVCLTSYHHCEASMGSAGTVQYERVGHAQGRCAIVASFKRAEYAADFILLARRARPPARRTGGLPGVPRGQPRMARGRAAREPHPPHAAPPQSRVVLPRRVSRGRFDWRGNCSVRTLQSFPSPQILLRLYPLRNNPQRIARPTAITPCRFGQLRAHRIAPEILTFNLPCFGVPKAFISRLYSSRNQTFDSKFAMFIPAHRLTLLVLRITFDL